MSSVKVTNSRSSTVGVGALGQKRLGAVGQDTTEDSITDVTLPGHVILIESMLSLYSSFVTR